MRERTLRSALIFCVLTVAFVGLGASSFLGQDGKAVFQINCGGPAVGQFAKDAYFDGGSIFDVSTVVGIDAGDVSSPPPTQVLRSQRYGNFSYAFSGLKPNTPYLVRLHFVEMYFNNQQVGRRIFNVAINRKVALDHFDILVASGQKNRAIVEEFSVEPGPAGIIRIVFESVVPFAAVNAIEIIEGPGGTPLANAAEVTPARPSNNVATIANKPTAQPVSTPGPRAAVSTAQEYNTRELRLMEIAHDLQDRNSNAVQLLAEAVRLCGFAIWKEDHSLVLPPTGTPLHLAITDNEIESFSTMFRAHQSVALADLINSVDLSYKKIDPAGSTKAPILKWLNNGDSSENESVRALTVFLHALNSRGAGKAAEFSDPKVQLDPIQALLILRVVTEEIGTPVKKAIFKRHGTGQTLPPQNGNYAFLPASYTKSSMPYDCAPEGKDWAEDAFVGGIAGLYEKAVEWVAEHAGVEELGEGYAKTLSWLNSLASLVKFIATYAWLKGEITVETPGVPLIRTKDRTPGEKRVLVAKFLIDKGKLDYWKEHRCWALFAGLDLDAPKNKDLGGIETSWRAGQSADPKKQIVQIAPGQGNPDRVLTDDNGEARLEWEGAAQPVVLDPKKVTPWDRIVDITVTPQVKRPEVKQDMVDALMGAIGIESGGLGLLTPIYEQLYRLKWNGTAYLPLRVRDWEQAETIGGMTMFLKASAHNFRQNYFYKRDTDRTLEFKDVAMQIVGAELPEFDPEALARMTPLQRAQTEAGIKAAQENAKKRTFIGIGPGKVSTSFSDITYKNQAADECGDISQSEETVTATGPPAGSKEMEFGPQNTLPGMTIFSVDVDTEKMTALVKGDFATAVKMIIAKTEDKKTLPPVVKDENWTFFHSLKPLSPYTEKGIVVPITKEDLDSDLAALGWEGYSYSGKVTIPFTFGSYKGNAYLAFYIKRVAKKKQ